MTENRSLTMSDRLEDTSVLRELDAAREHDVDTILERRRFVPLGEVFPDVQPETPLDRLALGTRVHNRMRREGYGTFGDLRPISIDDILGWGAVGVGSVRGMVRALLAFSSPPEPSPTGVPSAGAEPAWHARVIADLVSLARWHRLLGAEDATVFAIPEGIAEPDAVIAARDRLAQLSAHVVLPPAGAGGEASALFHDALRGFDDRDVLILRRRVFADAPETLEALGVEFGVTRELVRQREAKAKSRLRSSVESGDLAALARVVRDAVGTITPLRVLLQRFPSLTEPVDLVDQPIWRLLDRLDETYEIRDGWAARESVATAIDRTRELLAAHAGGRAYVELASIEDHDVIELSDDWLDVVGVKRLRGYALVGGAGITDRAAVLLEDSGDPIAVNDIHAALGVERSLAALKNGLAADSRFTRVDRDRWALADWGMRGYQSIRRSIAQIIDAAGGAVALSAVIEAITARVSVSPSSITTYAAAHPFVTQAGMVRRRTRRELRRPSRRRGLAQTRGLYRHPDRVVCRVVLTGEHLRGSGTPLPHALGEELDLLHGEKREVPVRGGGQVTVSWRGPQIAIGSIRDEVNALDLKVGDIAFLCFCEDGSFELVPFSEGQGGMSRLAALTGGVVDEADDPIGALADRIDSDAATVAALAHALSARGEHQLADLLSRLEDEDLSSTDDPSVIEAAALPSV